MIRALPHIEAMAPYALAQMTAPQGAPLISLAQNESLRPPCPGAIKAATAALSDGRLYPDPDWVDLRAELAQQHGISMENILCGAGSLDLIGCIARAYAGPGRAVLAPAHAYPFFRSAAQMANARFDTAPERETTVDVDALLAAVKPDTGLVCVANPGNPTGTRIPKSDLLRLRAGLRDDILLIVDEAYGEFADHLGEPAFDMVGTGTTLVLRTFSKAYGLAGARVGWGLFPRAIANELRKVMNPNNISAASQAAALAAVRDHDYMRETCALTAHMRDRFGASLQDAGFVPLKSFTNFLLIPFQDEQAARSADAFLQAGGIFLRPQGAAGLPHALRVTVGSEAAMDAALDRLRRWNTEEAI